MSRYDAGAMSGTQVHSGFWEGARQHVEDIKQVVQQQNSQAGRQLPVWITGHSLGGGYANCFMLHLLASKRTADLFSAGEFLSGYRSALLAVIKSVGTCTLCETI